MRSRWSWLWLVGAPLLLPVGVGSQEPAPQERRPSQQQGTVDEGGGAAAGGPEDAARAPEDAAVTAAGRGQEAGASQSDLELIENLLVEAEEVVEGGTAYEPGDRRDPFRSLLVVNDTPRREGPRPAGIAGLLIADLTITGVWVWEEGPVVQVEGAGDPVSFLLRPGDRLFDGEVLSISYSRDEGAEVVFRQIIDDPTSPKPFREIVRRLEP